MATISVVINTRNEEQSLQNAVKSVKGFVDEVVVVDMESTDKTVELAKKMGAKVYTHKHLSYVEPARNFAISKASSDWVLVLDPDEEIPPKLAAKLKEIVKDDLADYCRIPRKNVIFGHWMEHAKWWPDYNIRFFKKGYVSWNEVIHTVPMTQGRALDIDAKEELAIVHNNYRNIDEYLSKMIRYSKVQSEELIKNKYEFLWPDLITKPFNEFLGRYFAGQGYKDGLHGLALSILQSFSEFVVYLRVWGSQRYPEKEISKKEIQGVTNKNVHDLNWWIRKEFLWSKFPKFW